MLSREDYHVLRRAFDFEVEGQRKEGRKKRTWKKQVEAESVKVGLRMEDAHCWSRWIVSVNQIAAGNEVNLVRFTCWGYCQIFYVGLSIS